MNRINIYSLGWLIIAPLITYWLLVIIQKYYSGTVDPLWFILLLFVTIGILGFLIFSKFILRSLILILAIPIIHFLFKGESDPATPGVENIGLLIEGIFIISGWLIALISYKFIRIGKSGSVKGDRTI